MFNYDQNLCGPKQPLELMLPGEITARKPNRSSKWQEQGVQTDPSPAQPISGSLFSSASSSSSSSSSASSSLESSRANTASSWPLPAAIQVASEQIKQPQQQNQRNCILLLPQVVNNSALVHQRVSAKDCLAAASVNAATPVPLMAGGGRMGPKCLPDCPNLNSQAQQSNTSAGNLVPKNTALRAEQRKQNMISVVRPVVSGGSRGGGNHLEPSMVVNPIRAVRARLEDSPIWSQETNNLKSSILEDFMTLDRQITQPPPPPAGQDYTICDPNSQLELEEHFLSQKMRVGLGFEQGSNRGQLLQDQFGEQQARQQAALFRREEFELNRAVRKQHRFLIAKLEERKRGLQIVQAVWVQKGFKEAIERLVDMYHQGLIFTTVPALTVAGLAVVDRALEGLLESGNRNKTASTTLNSLNTSLVVDVLSVIILRPKLWNLEVCQLLLPIINNDLMMQTKPGYENYLEIGLKAVKLILTHFSSVIITTLDSHKDAAKTLVGVDLSREDRSNKCFNCLKLLLEARSIIRRRQQNFSKSNGCHNQVGGDRSSVNFIYRELDQLFASFESSIDPNQVELLSRRSNT